MSGEIPAFKGAVLYLDTALLDKITEEIQPRAANVVLEYGILMAGDAAKGAPVDTSALRNSILSESGMTGNLMYTVSDGVEYGVWQEFGTSRVPAHPFLIPAIEKWTSKFLTAFEDLFR